MRSGWTEVIRTVSHWVSSTAPSQSVLRHRTTLFMAQVNPETLRVMRPTGKVVVPERGAELGNFGANAISAKKSWVTVSKGMFMNDSKERGAEGATFVARILWAEPNQTCNPNQTPSFRGARFSSCHASRPVRLRFVLQDADLFALRFGKA